MATSILLKFIGIINKKAKGLLIFCSLGLLSFNSIQGQAPTWVAGTPSIPSTGPLTITTNYGIDMTGTVYILAYNFFTVTTFTGLDVKSRALSGLGAGKVIAIAIPVSAGNVGLVLQTINDVLNANTQHTIYFAAESSSGVIQATSIRLYATTKPCPMIGILTGFTQPVICINQNPVATFEVVILNPDPNVNGILKGTQWTLDWGDGTPLVNYTSTADNDIPTVGIRTHTYSNVTSCNYVFSNGIKNPCGQTRAVQYIAVVHGRDIPSDGDGVLRIVDNATGSSTINVCEGVQSIITLRDNSTWNCQNPVLPGGLTPVPNLDPRNIEWLYGRDPLGAITNTITGAVAIAGLGNAPQASGRLSPIPTPTTLSQAITIPATCVAGQFFRVYLKNWNKCNWADPDYVFTSVDINVVAAPPAPTAPNKTICFGGNRTLTVTSPAVGTLTWYSNVTLTTQVGTGANYTPVQTAVGSYPFWVVDKSNTGLQCQGPSTMVTLTINPIPTKPTISASGALSFCFDGGITSVTLTANPNTPPAITSYQWYLNGSPVGGAVTNNITLSDPAQSGNYTVTTFGINPSNCQSPPSDPVTVTVYSISNIVAPTPKTICENGSTTYTTSSTDPINQYRWQVSTDGGTTWNNVNDGGNYNGATTQTLQVINAPLSFSGYLYRARLRTVAGNCWFNSNSALLTVNPGPSANAGGDISRCSGTPLAAITMTGASAAGTYSAVTWTGGGGLGSWAQNANPALATFTPTVASGSFTATLTVTGGGACAGSNPTSTRVISWSQTPVPNAGADINRCSAVGTSQITMTLATATGTYSAATWSGGGGLGNWTQNANPALARFTPTVISGSFTATLTLTGSGACTGTNPTSTRVVSWSQTPVANAGAAISRCDGSPLNPILMTGATATGTYSGVAWSGGGGSGNWTQNADPALATFTPTTSTGSFTATLTVTGSGTCTGTNPTSTRTIAWGQTPTANAGANISRCDNNPTGDINMTGATAGGSYASVTWSGGGGLGNWSQDPNPANAKFKPTVNSGSFTATLTVTGTNGCTGTNATSTRFIEWGRIPTVNAGGNQTICSSGSATLNGSIGGGASSATWSGGAGTYLPNNTTLNAVYTPSPAEKTAGTVTLTLTTDDPAGPCTPVSDITVITINPEATVNAGPDQSICALGSATLAGSFGGSATSVHWSGGAGGYVPNNNTPNAVYTPSAGERGAGTVTLTLTTNNPPGPCPAVSDDVTITIGAPLSAATLTGSGDACFGASSTIRSVITGGAPPYSINYTRNGVAQAPVSPYTSGNNIPLGVLPAGTYDYKITSVTDPCGNSVPVGSLPPVYTIHINAIPDVSGTVPASQTICSDGTASITLNSTVNNTIFNYTVASAPGVGYSWTAGKDPVAGSITDADGNGTETISRQLQHNYNAAVTVFYTITPTGPGATACVGTPVTRSVIVNPVAAVNPMTTASCSGAAFSVTPVNGVNGVVPAGTTYSWAAPVVTGGMTGGAAGAGAASITGTLNNPTNTAQTATYTVTPLSGACTGATFTVTVTVNPKPAIANKATNTCSATSFTVTPVNGADIVPGGTTYSWAAPVVTGGMTGGAAGAGAASISGTLNNPTNTNQTATYTVTPLSGACTGATFTVTVTVNPKPNIANKVATTCSGTAFTVTPVNGADIVPGGTTYSWAAPVVTGGMTGGAAGAGAANISGTLNNPTNVAQTATYTVTPLSGACTGSTFTVTVTVNPTAVIANKVATTCGGTAFSVTPVNGADIVPGGTTYSWAAPVVTGGMTGGAGGAGAASITGTLNNPTNTAQTATYTVTPLSGACTGATFTVTVTVNPKPNIANKLATTCSGTAFTVTPVNGADIVPGGTTYSWAAPVVTGGMTGGAAGAGAANISGTLNNPTNTNQTATYTVTPLSGACTGSNFTVTVTINPTPVIANKAATTCGGTAFSVTPVNGADIVPGGTTYSWAAPVVTGGMTGGAAGAGAASITGTLNNPTNTAQTATYTVTPLSGACTGATFTVTVTVNPKPAIANKATNTCSATSFTVTPVNGADIVPGGTTYSWAAPVVTGGMTGGAAGAGAASISGTLNNPTNTNQTATYTVTPLSGACTGATFTVTVTVNPKPNIANKVATTCSGTAFTVTPVNGADIVPGGTTYSWAAPVVTGGMTGGAAGAGAANISGTLNNPTNVAQTATYTVTPLSGACTGSTFTVTVTVNPTAVIANKVATTCGGTAFSVTPVNGADIVPGGTTYSWAAPVVTGGMTGGAGGAGAASITGTLNNPTNTAQTATYTVTPLSGACTGATFTVTVTVNPKPNIANKLATTCSGTAFTVTPVNGADIVPGGTTYSWAAPVVTGGMTGGAAGAGAANISGTLNNPTNTNQTATYTVTPLSGACTGSNFTVTVTINPTPVIANKAATTCGGTAFSVTPVNGADIVPGGTTYSWAAPVVTGGMTGGAGGAGAANISGTLNNPTNTAQTATYTVTPLSGACTGATFTVTVTVNPTPAITNMTGTSCTGALFTITPVNITNGIVPAGTTYSWPVPVVTGGITGGAAGAGAAGINGLLSNPSTSPQTATYTVTPTSGGCVGTAFTLTVTINPSGQVNQPVNQVVCNGANTAAIAFSTVNTVGVTTYNWTNSAPSIGLPAGGSGDIAAFAAVNAGTIPVVATIVVTPVFTFNAIACTGSTKTFTITVNPTPTLSGTLTPPDVCSNTAFSYVPASATAGTTFNWNRATVPGITPAGPTSGINNPNETLRNITGGPVAVTYQYTLSANGCNNVQNVVVNINPEPVITAGQNTAACSGNALNYQILLNNFVNPGDNVTFTWPVPVLNPVNPGFTGGTARVSASAANITDIYTNTMGVMGTATYTVTPYKNGCAGTPVTIVVNVGSEPVLDPGLNAFACSNTPIGLILKEAAGSVVPTYYNVISKTVAPGLTDAGNAAIPNATAPANYLSTDKFTNTTGIDKTVTYRVQPILAPSCIGAAVDVIITIRPQPVILPAQTKTVCSGVPIGKEIVLVPSNTPAGTLFSWPVPVISDATIQGTAGTNVAADPAGTIHINDAIDNLSGAPITATYTITPVSSFGCAGTPTTAIFTINPEPVPQIISGRDKICVTDKNVVYNVSAVSGSSFHWTVDPAVGTKSFDLNANAILVDAAAVAGSGNISVYETNSYTCNGDPSIKAVQVYSVPAPENIIGPATVCANSTQIYSVTNRAGSVYSWTVPGGAAVVGDPSANSITVIFANVGGTITVRETNAAGCITNHNPLNISLNQLPTATISGGGTICDGASRNLSVAFTGAGPYSFTYALNGVPQAPINTASNPYTLNVTLAGTYTIVNVTDANCTNIGTGTTTVSYFPKPTGIISGTTAMCRGNSTTLTFTFTGTAPYNFTYTDGTTPVTVNGHLTSVYTASVSPIANTTYTLTSLTDGNACTGVVSGSAVITVNQPPVLTLVGTNLICYNVSTGAVDMTITGGTAPFGITWTGPDSFTASTEDISGLKQGYYAVTVLDTKGCTATANITLTQPPVLNGSASGTNITCFGANDGTITISGATGGAGVQEFTIDGGVNWQVAPGFTGLAPGTYNVIMRDAVNPTCMLTLNSSLLLTGPAVLNATIVKTDVSCFAANNGSIVISSPTGGYGTYGYSIDGGANWQGSGNFTNLAPGNYNVRIRDAVHTACDLPLASFTVTEPPVLSATVSSTNISCFGSTDGTITISSPAGGHGTYEYSINGGGSWQGSGNYTNLSPGTYNIQIRDAAFTGCYIVLNNSLVITQPAVLAASVASTNVTCNGADDGIINITAPAGGYGTYQYSIDGGTNWLGAGTFNGLAPGTYDVRIRDAAHALCEIILNSGLQITEPAILSAVVVPSDITCFGANDGVININNSAGGYGTYQYSIDGGAGWQDSPTFPGLTQGTYDVRIRDKAHTGCVIILNAGVVIAEPAILSAAVASANVTCFGAGDGTITISSPSGGSGSYGYSINGGTSWQGSGNFTGLVPGTYNIRIRDAVHTGCIIPLNPAVVITQPAVLSASIVKTNVTCNGAADGTITINGAAGGYGTYEYTVDGGSTWQASNIFTGLLPGFYNVKIRDAFNQACIVTLNGSLNVTEPSALAASVARTNISCNGAADGTITISSPSGGYGTYNYSINGGTTWQATGSFSGLTPGNYNVQLQDAAHPACIITLNPALAITEPAVLAATVNPTNVSCFGANNGIINISGASGGYGTYEYTINGGTNWSGLANFTNLSPGTYDVRIRDAAHIACVTTLNGALVITQPAVLTATVAKTNISCFGASDGTITISSPAGGYGTYDYSINGGGSWQGSGSFTALGPGNYNVQIRDAAHITCVIVLNNALQITQPPVLNAAVTPTNVTCFGGSDGLISITAPSGGYGTYQYSIDGGTGWQASGLFPGLAPGTFDVRMRDAANPLCEIVLNNSLTITEPPVLNAGVISTNVTCFGANNGTITVQNPSGGYGTYEYSNNGGAGWQATGIFTNLLPGSYNVQIRDKAHPACAIVLNPALMIAEPAVLSATPASTNVTCFGANNGTITISNPLGGYGTYGYSVNGGTTWQSSGTFTGLAPATYNVKIRDAANPTCEITLNAALVITQPAVLSAAVASTNVTCNGANDGTITVSSPAGGYGTYEYSVNGGASWQASGNFTALTPGFYNVQIRDAANISCVRTLNGSLRITEPNTLSASIASTNVTCNGAGDGTITITSPSGGYGTYDYSVSGGGSWQPSGAFSALTPGTYNVQIRDAAHTGCIIVLNPALVITQPAVLSATVTPTNVTCNGANDGIISITSPAGGYGSYQYTINGGTSWSGSGNFTNLAPATYNVQMRDASQPSCIITLNGSLAITQPALLSANITSTNVTCFGSNDGTITISGAAGGYGTYQYSINGGGSWQASGNFTGLTTGSYSVLIRDAAHNGCVIVLNNAYSITQPALLSAAVSKTDVTCNGANDGTISITAPAGGYGTYDYTINGGTSWQPAGNYSNLLPGSYDVRIRDAAHPACSVILYPNLLITEPVTLAMTSTGNINLNCFGDNTGTGTFYASGGTMPYNFTVVTNTAGATISFPGFNSQTFFGAGAGTVTVSVTDQNGCFAQASIVISQPALLTPGSIAADQVICSGSNPAQLTETTPATGGPAAYNYQWQYGSTAAGPFINIAGATASQYTPATGATTTLYYRRMVTSGMCAPVYSNVIEVLVNPLPLAILSGGETICPAQTSILKVNMMVGTGPFDIDIQNHGTVNGYVSGSDIVVSPAVTTTYKLLSVRDANGCQVLDPSPNLIGSATVTVRALPAITVQPVSKTSCEFGMIAYNVTATGSDLVYQWYVNEGSGFAPVTDGGVYFGATTSTLNIFGATRDMNGYVYHVVVTGCSSSVTSNDVSLTVNTPPEIINQPKDSTICMNAGATYSVTATGTNITYQWQVNKGAGFVNVVNDANFSGSTLNTLTITNAPGTFNNYIFRVVISGTCGIPVYSNFVVLRVNNPPIVTLNPVDKAVCDGTGPVLFSANGSGMIDSLRWQVFSGGIWSEIFDNAIYSGSTSQQLTLSSVPIAFNGNQYRLSIKAKCTTVYSNAATLTVNANPVVDFSGVDPLHACGGVPLVINGNPSGGSGVWASHLWTGDIGPLNNYYIQSPSFTSQIAGTYNLTYQVKDSKGCFGRDDVSVIVDAPDATFTWDVSSGCTPATISFSKDMTGIARFWWDFNDGSPVDSVNANPVHQFINVNPSSIEYHNVKLTVRSPGGCLDSYSALITVYPAVDATFTASPDSICSGKSISFTALTGASKYFWDYGDGVSGYSTNNASHLYTNVTTSPVVYTVTLTTTSFYSCTDVKTLDIVVMPVPIPQFSADPPTQIFDAGGNPVVFTNQTNAGSWNWSWTFGDGATSTVQDPSHTYTGVGVFNVALTADNSVCSASVTHQVNITYSPPVANFDTLLSGCSPVSLAINNTSLNTDIPGTTYRWEFGDGSTSTAKNPTYTYFDPGIFRVELTVTGPGGTSVKSQVINSYASPKAYFEISPTKVFVNDEKVRCFNLSEGASYYLWDFGDGDTSKVAEPFHKYMEEGVYDITLWAYSENGCSDKYLLSPGVTVEPPGDLRFATVFTPNKDAEIDMDHLPTGGPEIDQFFFPPIREKVINYKLQIFNRWGVLIFETHDINKPWNGYYKGTLCAQGVYVWYVEGKYENGMPFKKVGDVTLLH